MSRLAPFAFVCVAAAVPAVAQAVFPGSSGDFVLALAVNGVPAPPHLAPTAVPGGSVLHVTALSPVGTGWFAPFVVLGNVVGAPPAGPFAGTPGLWLDPAAFLVPIVVPAGPIVPLVPPGGDVRQFSVPPGLGGIKLMMQAAAVFPQPSGALLALSDAYFLVF